MSLALWKDILSNLISNEEIYIQVTIRDCIFLRISPGSFQVKRTKEVRVSLSYYILSYHLLIILSYHLPRIFPSEAHQGGQSDSILSGNLHNGQSINCIFIDMGEWSLQTISGILLVCAFALIFALFALFALLPFCPFVLISKG